QKALPLLERCIREDKTVVIRGAFNSGILATGATNGAHFDYGDAPADILERVRTLDAVCRSHGVPLAAAALQVPLPHPAVRTVIPGVGSRTELDQVLQWAACALPPALWDDLQEKGLIERTAPVPSGNACVMLP